MVDVDLQSQFVIFSLVIYQHYTFYDRIVYGSQKITNEKLMKNLIYNL